MLGKTHIIFGIFLATFFSQPYLWVIILIASLLPDIDSTTSYLGRKIKTVGRVFEHRGFFHSFFFFIPASIIIFSLNFQIGLAFTLGMGSHLLLDMMTKQGLRLYPFKKRIKGMIKVGSFKETLLRTFFLLLIVFRLLIY